MQTLLFSNVPVARSWTRRVSLDSDDLPRQFGDFTLLRLIAQGGMGAVYLALRPVDVEESQMRHLPEGQEEVCVVKTVRADLKQDREAVGRFLDEARVVQKLTHPRIARTLDAGVIDKTYYLALEFISGRNLRDVHTRAQKLGRALPEALIVHVLSEMLEALDYAHKLKDPDNNKPLNIVHRDVSPHNVMMGFDGTTRLIDFGLAAHELKRELTRPGVMVGKLRYNAPEQVRDRAMDGRSDVYAAGVVLYEFLANERFYEGLPEEQVWRVAMKGDHRPRSWRDIDSDWRNLLDVALQNDLDKRYKDARGFRMALLDVAEGRGIELSSMRKASKAFMADVFGREYAQEREMLLQATGIAEARTRLFRSPSELQSAIQNIPQPRAAKDVVDMRTEILDTNAAHLMELRDMMSQLADPDAETMLPNEPVDSGVRGRGDGRDDGSDDDTGDGPSLSEAAAAAAAMNLRGRERDRGTAVDTHNDSADDSVDDGPGDPRADRRYARVGDDEPAPTVQSRGRQGQRSASSPSSAPPEPNPGTNSMARRQKREGASRPRSEPLPPLPPRPGEKRGNPVIALAVGLFVVVLVGVAAILIIPRLLAPSTTIVAPVDGVVVDAPPPPPAPEPAPEPPPPPAPAPEPPPPAPAPEPPPPPAPAPQPPPAPVPSPQPPPVPSPVPSPSPSPSPSPPPTPPPTRPVGKGPPSKVPTTLAGQLGYLKQHCVGRVQCARSLAADADNFAKMSPVELKDLRDAVPKCIEKCRRN